MPRRRNRNPWVSFALFLIVCTMGWATWEYRHELRFESEQQPLDEELRERVETIILEEFEYEAWLPTAYLPSPLGDTSYLRFFADVAEGVSNTAFEFADAATWVPPLWCLATFGLAALVLSRRSVP